VNFAVLNDFAQYIEAIFFNPAQLCVGTLYVGVRNGVIEAVLRPANRMQGS